MASQGDWRRKVQPGETLASIPRDAYNEFIDAAETARRSRVNTGSGTPTFGRDTSLVTVRNMAGEDVNHFCMLELTNPVVGPSDNLDTFLARVNFDGVTPTAAGVSFCVLLEPLAEGALGRGVVVGTVPVLLDVVGEDDATCDVVAGQTGYLLTGSGSTRVLYVEPAVDADPDTGLRRGYVLLGMGGGTTGGSGGGSSIILYQAQQATATAGGIQIAWGLGTTGPTTQFIILYREGSPSSDVPVLSGWTIVEVNELGATNSRVIVYRRYGNATSGPTTTILDAPATSSNAVAMCYSPGGSQISLSSATDHGTVAAGTYDFHPTRLILTPVHSHVIVTFITSGVGTSGSSMPPIAGAAFTHNSITLNLWHGGYSDPTDLAPDYFLHVSPIGTFRAVTWAGLIVGP